MPKLTLKLNKETDEWWIEGHDPPIGPYDLKKDAVEDLAGVTRFYKHEYKPDAIDLALEDIL